MNPKHFFRIFRRVLLLGAGTLIFFIILICQLDTATVWRFFPGVNSSKEIQEFGNGMIAVVEDLPDDENTQKMVLSMVMMGSVASAAGTAQEGGIDDQIMSQYTLGLIKACLLEKQGDLSPAEYLLYKFPFQTGNTKIMELALPSLQKKAQLPEGFMSEEDIKAQLEAESRSENKPEQDRKLEEYKEQYLYGRYYQMDNYNSYLDILGSADKTHDIIRFVATSDGESHILEQKFNYRMDQTFFITEDNITEFKRAENSLILIRKGGVKSPCTYLKANEFSLVFPDSDVRKLTKDEVDLLDDEDRRFAKNEIYARHDYPFQDPELREFFGHFGWYGPEGSPEEFQESVFSEVEQYNLELLK